MTPHSKTTSFARRLFAATWATLLLAVALGAGLADARASAPDVASAPPAASLRT